MRHLKAGEVRFMRKLLWRVIQYFLFLLDAESVHRFTVILIRMGIRFGNAPLRIVSGTPLFETGSQSTSELPEVFGIRFQSRIGLAAGFDKNGEVIAGLPALGFGFAEIGSVTPKSQVGNERPRLFRDPPRQALFNRMGFGNRGAEAVSALLAQARPNLPSNFRVGVNLGKNKDTPLNEAVEDYLKVAKAFEGLSDYLVINVSSPNTPGLRSLQTITSLKPIVSEVAHLIQGWKTRVPLLLKLAPEIHGSDLVELVQAIEPLGLDGWVLTNTLGGSYGAGKHQLQGGWSGKPLTDPSRNSLVEARKATQKPIISVGGIFTPEEALSRISGGADLVQIYTGWIFGGPTVPWEMAQKTQRPQTEV